MDTTTTIRKIRTGIKPAARCRRSKAQQVKKRTARIHTDAFLTHRFTPFWGIAAGDWKQTEREFKNSLSNLCLLYDWRQPYFSNLAFPENIHSAFQELKEKFKTTALDCIIGQDTERRAALVTVKTFNIGMTLYYIPVRPVWRMIQDKIAEPLTNVLLSVFSYLYNITGIPFYRKDCYLNNTYGYLQNMLDDDDEQEDEEFHQIQQEELSTLREAGDKLLTYITRNFSIERFSEQLTQYKDSKELFGHLLRRETKKRKGRFCSRIELGSKDQISFFKEIARKGYPIEFEIFIVQPGLSSVDPTVDQLSLLGVVDSYVKGKANIQLTVIGS